MRYLLTALAVAWGLSVLWLAWDIYLAMRQAWRLRQVHDAAYRERRGQGEEPTHG